MIECKRDRIAFTGTRGGYLFTAWYLTEPKGGALITIEKDNQMVREFLFPAYKIWNIQAHADDIALSLDQESDEGLYIAGSTGFGGNAYTGSTETNSPPSEGVDSRTGVSDGSASCASLPDAGVTQEGTTCEKVGTAAGKTAVPGETLRRDPRAQPDAHAGVL